MRGVGLGKEQGFPAEDYCEKLGDKRLEWLRAVRRARDRDEFSHSM